MKPTTLLTAKNILFVLTFLLGTIGLFAQNTVLNNNRLRIGNGSQNSINTSGNMQQPFYYNGSTYRKLTYSTYPLDIRWGIGGDGTNDWNINGTLLENPVLTNQTFDVSGFTVTNAGTGEGYGEIITTGQITVGGQLFEVQNTYELLQPEGYISINVKITNISASPATNVRLWVGTRDDYVGGSDGPTKQRGNLVGEEFELLTNQTDQAKAIKILTTQEAILFFSNSDRAYSTINSCCSFSNATNQNPATNLITQSGDGSYALYVKMNDLAINESDDFTWYYGAGTLPEIDEIIASIANAAGAFQNITENSADYEVTVSENGTGYWMLVPQGSTPPTPVEIKTGANYGGVTILSSGNTPMLADVESIINLTSLQHLTTYDFYFVSEYFDGVSDVYTDVLDESFTTLDLDTDGDGVFDTADNCAGTTTSLSVDTNGCATVSGIVTASNDPSDGGYDDDDLIGMGIVNSNPVLTDIYEEAITNEAPAPNTLAELQAVIDAVNATVQGLAEVLEDSNSPGGADNTNGTAVTAVQLAAINGIVNVIPANELAYQIAINTETGFSNPPTVTEVQTIINSVNTEQTLLAAIGIDEEDGAATTTNATAIQLNDIVGVTGAIAANEGDYQDYINANAGNFSSPATAAEVQTMIDSVNAAQDLLTAIGIDEEDGAATTTNATAIQLNNIVGVTGAIAANEGDYQDYIDANAGNFSSPATAAELQTMIDSVNAAQDLLTAIGIDEEDGAATTTNATAIQLNNIVGVTGAIAANEGDYQDYIDANAGNFSSPATAAELQTMIDSVNAAQDLLTAIGIDEEDGAATTTNATAIQLNDIVGVTGAIAANEGDYQDYINANASNFSSPATAAEVQTMIDSVNAAQDLLTAIGIDEEDGATTTTNATAIQLNDIVGVTGAIAANEGDYQDYINVNAGNFSSPATAAEVQTMIDSVNAAQDLLTAIGIDEEDGATTTTNATAIQLNDIVGVTGAIAANEGDYQDYIDANAGNFSSPATAAELQTMIDSVNAAQDLLTAIGIDEEDGAATTTNATAIQLNNIVGVTGAIAANEGDYQDYINANASNFSSPATAAEVQTMIDSVNAAQDLLTAIGIDEEDGATTTNATAIQLNDIVGVSNAIAANESEYQDYIDANAGNFSSPATAAEVQTMIDSVNAAQDLLTTIGIDEEDGAATTTNATAIQLNDIVGVSNAIAANESEYQDYIDTNAGNFSSPATAAEVQTMIDSVNAAQDLLTAIGIDEEDGATTTTNATAIQLNNIVGVTGAIAANEGDYQDYIDANAGNFSSPATAAEVQTMIDSVNAAQDLLTAIGIDEEDGATTTTNATAIQLNDIVGVSNAIAANESDYQDYIDANAGNFSSPATAAEVQAMIDATNTSEAVLAQIGNEGDEPDTTPSIVTVTQLETITGITAADPTNEMEYQEYIDTYPELISDPATLAEVQELIDAVNTSQEVLTQIGSEGDEPDTTPSIVTVAQLETITGITGVDPTNEMEYQEFIDAYPELFSDPATEGEVQTMINAVNTSQDVLTQIGSEGDDPDTISSEITTVELESITGIMDVNSANEMRYQTYIDEHPELFSDPATVAEIQAMIETVNDSESVLVQIGTEGDDPDTIPSVITVDQLNNISGIMGVDSGNETVYQEYIDTNPESFASPATFEQVQAMITEVNEIAVIVANSNDPADGNPSEAELLEVGITEANPEYVAEYEEAIANADPAPISLEELQIIIDAVNDVEDNINATLSEILEDSNAPDGEDDTNGTAVTADQLEEVPGLVDIVTNNEQAYQIAINNETGFSNPPTVEEIQEVINTVNNLIDLIDNSDVRSDGSPSISDLEENGIAELDPLREELYETAIANANPQPQSLEELQAIIDQVNTTPLSVISAEAFTPNGDGINDGWVIDGILDYPNNTVRLYNRNGAEVFAAEGYQNDWEGFYNNYGEKLPAGSYYYIINLGDGSKPIDGWIFLNY